MRGVASSRAYTISNNVAGGKGKYVKNNKKLRAEKCRPDFSRRSPIKLGQDCFHPSLFVSKRVLLGLRISIPAVFNSFSWFRYRARVCDMRVSWRAAIFSSLSSYRVVLVVAVRTLLCVLKPRTRAGERERRIIDSKLINRSMCSLWRTQTAREPYRETASRVRLFSPNLSIFVICRVCLSETRDELHSTLTSLYVSVRLLRRNELNA